jgi:hypothetical protein
MSAAEVDCRVVQRLLGRWHDGELPADESEVFEEHLVLCPPCLVENQRLTVALAALERVAGTRDEGRRTLPEAPAPTASPGRYWKFLRAGLGPFTAFQWVGTAGRWVEADGRDPCARGVHACRAEDLPYWLTDELWEVELAEPVPAEHKVVARQARLIGRVTAWTPAAGRALALACLQRTVHHAVAELRTARLDDEAERLAAAAAAGGGETSRARLVGVADDCAASAGRRGRRQAAALSLLVVDAVDYLGDTPPATLAYIAARAAHRRSGLDDDAYEGERRWQAAWLVERLGLAAA